MLKHRGFPGRLPGSDYQFVIRRENRKKGATPITRRERFKDRRPPDKRADAGFLSALIAHFGDQPFVRGNLDAGRLSWLIGREVKPIEPYDPADYEQMFQIDMAEAQASFPELFVEGAEDDFDWDADDLDDDDDDDEAGR